MSRFISILMSAVLALCLLTVRAEAKTEPVPVKLEPEVALGAYMGLVEEHLGGIQNGRDRPYRRCVAAGDHSVLSGAICPDFEVAEQPLA